MGEDVGAEQDKERVLKGADVNEREVWKQRFISPNPVSRERGGGERRKGGGLDKTRGAGGLTHEEKTDLTSCFFKYR